VFALSSSGSQSIFVSLEYYLCRLSATEPDIERLVLEVQFSRGVINEIDVYFKSIHQAWRDNNLGELVALEKVRLLLVQQHVRQNVLAGLKPAPRKNEPPEPEPALID
jgi:hypothetical protein